MPFMIGSGFTASLAAGGGGGGGPPLDGISNLTGAWSVGRELLTGYGSTFTTDTSSDGDINIWHDQSGASRNFVGSPTTSPTLTTAGNNSRACLRFNGTYQFLQSGAGDPLSDFITASAGYIICSFIVRAVTTNAGAGAQYNNDLVFADSGGYVGAHLNNGGGSTYGVRSYNYSGGEAIVTQDTISLNTAYVYEWWHTGGTLFGRLNGGTTRSTASGNTDSISSVLGVGYSGVVLTQIDIFEMAAFNVVPSGGDMNAMAAAFAAWVG